MTALGPHSGDAVERGLTPRSLVSVRTLNRHPLLVSGVCTRVWELGHQLWMERISRRGRGQTVKGMEALGGQEEGGACLGAALGPGQPAGVRRLVS